MTKTNATTIMRFMEKPPEVSAYLEGRDARTVRSFMKYGRVIAARETPGTIAEIAKATGTTRGGLLDFAKTHPDLMHLTQVLGRRSVPTYIVTLTESAKALLK